MFENETASNGFPLEQRKVFLIKPSMIRLGEPSGDMRLRETKLRRRPSVFQARVKISDGGDEIFCKRSGYYRTRSAPRPVATRGRSDARRVTITFMIAAPLDAGQFPC